MQTKLQTNLIRMMTAEQLAVRLGVKESTLEDWRKKGQGPTVTKLGFARNAPIRYSIEDIEAWENTLPRITPIAHGVDAAYQRAGGGR